MMLAVYTVDTAKLMRFHHCAFLAESHVSVPFSSLFFSRIERNMNIFLEKN